jgi:hypothetical protein
MTLPIGLSWPLAPSTLMCWQSLHKRPRILLRAERAVPPDPAPAAGFSQGRHQSAKRPGSQWATS